MGANMSKLPPTLSGLCSILLVLAISGLTLLFPAEAYADWERLDITWQAAGTSCGNTDSRQAPTNPPLKVNDMPLHFSPTDFDFVAMCGADFGEAPNYVRDINWWFIYECGGEGEFREIYESHFIRSLHSGFLRVGGQNIFEFSVSPADLGSVCTSYTHRLIRGRVGTSVFGNKIFGHIANIVHFWWEYGDSDIMSYVPPEPSYDLGFVRLMHLSGTDTQSATFAQGWSLHELNSSLSNELSNVLEIIDDELDGTNVDSSTLNDHRDQIPWEKVDRLIELQREILDLLDDRIFDDITVEELLNILDRYMDVLTQELVDALLSFFDTLLNELEDLRAQLESDISEARNEYSDLADVLTDSFENYGIDPEHHDYHNPIVIGELLPPVELPHPSEPPGESNVYLELALEMIGLLEQTVSGDFVTDREGFLGVWSVWINWYLHTLDFLTCQSPTVCSPLEGGRQRHYTDLSQANSLVYGFVVDYFDTNSGLFLDVKSDLDGEVLNALDDIEEVFGTEKRAELREVLNLRDGDLWDPNYVTDWDVVELRDLQYAMIIFVGTLGMVIQQQLDGMGYGDPEFAGYGDPDFEALNDAKQIALDAVKIMSLIYRVPIGFLPVAGPFFDLCEAATGHEWCVPDGRELSTGERALALASAFLGSAAFWSVTSNVFGGIANNILGGFSAAATKTSEIVSQIQSGAKKHAAMFPALSSIYRGPAQGFQVSPSFLAIDRSKNLTHNVNGVEYYTDVNFVYLHENISGAGNINASPGTWGLGGQQIDEWTFAVEAGTHRVRIAPRVVTDSPVHLAAQGAVDATGQPQIANEIYAKGGGVIHTVRQGELQPHVSWIENDTRAFTGLDSSTNWHDNYIQRVMTSNKTAFPIVDGMYSQAAMVRLATTGKNKNATRRLFGPHWVSNDAAQAYGLPPGWDKLEHAFEASVGMSMVNQGHRMLVAGDQALIRSLNLQSGHTVVDFVTVNQGKLVLTEVKGKSNWHKGFEQLKAVHSAMPTQVAAGQIGSVRIARPTGSGNQSGDYQVQNGFLYEGQIRQEIGGLPVKVIDIQPVF